MSATPAFTATPRCAISQLSTANTARDGSGTLVDVFVAGASGSRIEHLDLQASVTVTAGVVRLFITDGAATRLIREILVTATTPSTSVAAWSTSISFAALSQVLVLPPGYTLRASTHNAEAINVAVFGGDF